MSDFDDNDVVKEAGSDFDSNDVVGIEAPQAQEQKQEADPVAEATRMWGLGTVGALTGAGLNKLSGMAIDDALMPLIGDLTGEDIDKIDANRKIYNELPKSAIEDKFNEYKTLGQKTIDSSVNHANQAREALKGADPYPVQDYHRALAAPLLDEEGNVIAKYGDQLPDGKEQSILTQHLDEAAPDLNLERDKLLSVDEELKKLEQQITNPLPNERQLVNQKYKDLAYHNRMQNLAPALPDPNKQAIIDEFNALKEKQKLGAIDGQIANAQGKSVQPLEDMKADTSYLDDSRQSMQMQLNEIDEKRKKPVDYEKQGVREEFNQKKLDTKLEQIDRKIEQSQKNIDSSIQKAEQKKQNFTAELEAKKQKAGKLQELGKVNAENKFNARKEQITFNKVTAESKALELKAIREKERLEKLMEQKQKLQGKKAEMDLKLTQKVDDIKGKAAAQFDATRRTPKPIIDAAPELNNFALGKPYAESLGNALSKAENIEQVTPSRMDQIVQELRETDVNYSQSGPTNNFNKELAASVQGKLKQDFPKYKDNLALSEESHKTEELWNKLGVTKNDKLDRVTLEDGGKSRINRILLDPDKYKEEYGFLKEALQDAINQGNLPPGSNVDELLKTAQVAALKSDVGRLRQGKDLNAFDINSIAKGELSRAPGIMSKLGGTRLQELYGAYKNSGFGKGVQAAGRYGLPVVGALAGAAASANAMDEGKIGPTEAGALAVTEAFNPTPFDVQEAYLSGKDGYKADVDAQKATESYFNGQDVSQGQALGAGAKAAAIAFKRPMEEHGQQVSTEARDRMAKRLGVKEKPAHEDFKTFVEQKPEQIQNLAEVFKSDDSLQSFVAPLEKAAGSDDRTRSAVLFGLYQQPAFRQALKGKKGM